MPAAALSRALTHVTGRATKELILDRVMLEAARLLRFTDLSVQEVAQRTGYADPLYFSRAFKRQRGRRQWPIASAPAADCARSPCIRERFAIAARRARRDPRWHDYPGLP